MTKEDWKKTGKIMLGIACCLGGTVPLSIASVAAEGVSKALDWGSDRLADGARVMLDVGGKLINDGR